MNWNKSKEFDITNKNNLSTLIMFFTFLHFLFPSNYFFHFRCILPRAFLESNTVLVKKLMTICIDFLDFERGVKSFESLKRLIIII